MTPNTSQSAWIERVNLASKHLPAFFNPRMQQGPSTHSAATVLERAACTTLRLAGLPGTHANAHWIADSGATSHMSTMPLVQDAQATHCAHPHCQQCHCLQQGHWINCYGANQQLIGPAAPHQRPLCPSTPEQPPLCSASHFCYNMTLCSSMSIHYAHRVSV
jgi:hypothetical protein